VANQNEVITFHNIFLAYNPDVLMLQSLTWGNAMQADPGTKPSPQSVGATNYTAVAGYTPPSDWNIGTPDTPPVNTANVIPNSGSPISNPFYYEGSVRLQETAVDTALDIYNARYINSGTATLFTAVFNVSLDMIGKSSIVLIDDRYFLTDPKPNYDWKLGSSLTPTPIEVVDINQIKVPVPAPLALMAAGLLGFGVSRRIKR